MQGPNLNPTTAQLRQFALLWLPLSWGILGTIAYCKFNVPNVAYGLWSGAAIIAIVGLFSPKSVKFVFVAITMITYPVGWTVSHVLLAAIFFLLFTPVGLIMRVFGRDPLNRKFDREAKSYWIPIEPPKSPNENFRQY